MQRLELLKQWLGNTLNQSELLLEPASSDASFRQYFRVTSRNKSYIVMDAPPSQEDVGSFIKITHLFQRAGINVPKLYAEDVENGFLLLGDLGLQDYLSALNSESVERLYGDAISALLTLQTHCCNDEHLPAYDRAMLQKEMMLFSEWYLGRHLGLELTHSEQTVLQQVFLLLETNALTQPQLCVHRDYHSRNLMVCAKNNPGVLDYQDAVVGPISYDLVSLLKDCYIDWPEVQRYHWVSQYYQQASSAGLLECDESQFIEWFDLMGMQRHLKAAGIFARLNYRDGKSGYLNDIPRTLNYLLEMAKKYPQFSEMAKFFKPQVPLAHIADVVS